jgi:uncharacterized membrane protein
MTSVETAPPVENAARRFNWLKLALVMSLAVNLLFIGGGIARLVTHGPPERMSNISQMQLIPRKFLGDLDRARRTELMKVFREFAPSFRDGRKATRDEVINLAAALEAEPYDAARVKTVIEMFSAQSSALIGSGGKAALTLIDKLTPEERKLLARHIRLRDDGGHKKDAPGRDD